MIQRKFHEWRPKSLNLRLGERTVLIGWLDVAPDGPEEGRYTDVDRAVARALEMKEQGAALVELAGEHLTPTGKPLADAEEIRRVIPLVKRLREAELPVIVRTWKQAVAEKALVNGATAIHDISGLTWNPDLAKLTVQHDAGLILNHMRGEPGAWAPPATVKDIVEQSITGLGAAAHRANRSNVDRRRILLDAGLGLGKRREHNLELLAGLARFGTLGLPVGLSIANEPFLVRGDEAESNLTYSAAITAAILSGAYLVTVRDVEAARRAVQLADALLLSVAQTPDAPVPPSPRAAASKRADEPLATRARVRPTLRQ